MVIGILGGMGSYATLDIFKRLLEAFPAEKEWDRPRIVIDNNCTMPSRVVAALYGTNREKLVEQMSGSVKALLAANCTHIFFACNTSHIFLDEIYTVVPEAKGKIINIIDCLANNIKNNFPEVKQAALVATEGTLDTRIYQNVFKKYDIEIEAPKPDTFPIMRELIESVKQNCMTAEHCKKFIELIKTFKNKHLILGCTEFPVLYTAFKTEIDSVGLKIFDPLEATIQHLKRLYIAEKSSLED